MTKEDLIIIQLEEIKISVKELGDTVVLCRIDIAGLKIKAGVWGAMAGLIPGLVGVLMWALSVWR